MPQWRRIDANLERVLVVALYGYFCLIILIEVARRHLFGASSQWGEMTARYAFVYLVYIAAAEVMKTGDHIRIDIVPRLLPPRLRLALHCYFDVLCLALAALIVWFSIEVLQLSVQNNVLMTGFDANMALAQAALPLGWLLLSYRVMQRFARTYTTYRNTGDVPLGGGGANG
jgi:TRAP-type C4-dicarboxylate transport system permease small subunit